jgi:hypothetical protein
MLTDYITADEGRRVARATALAVRIAVVFLWVCLLERNMSVVLIWCADCEYACSNPPRLEQQLQPPTNKVLANDTVRGPKLHQSLRTCSLTIDRIPCPRP